jgi:hypothetical protein
MFTVTLITVTNTKFSFQIFQLILILLNTSFSLPSQKLFFSKQESILKQAFQKMKMYSIYISYRNF